MIAENVSSNLVDPATGVAAVNYEKSNEFGLVLYLAMKSEGTEISVAQLNTLKLSVDIEYIDSMLSETSMGRSRTQMKLLVCQEKKENF
jgi:hypothetical protein